MIKRLGSLVYLCAVLVILYFSVVGARDVLGNATPNAKETRAWVRDCKVRTNLPCVP